MNRSRTARAQTQAAGLAGKAPITFGLRFTFSSGRSSRFVERSRLRRRSGYSRCTQSAGRSSARQAAALGYRPMFGIVVGVVPALNASAELLGQLDDDALGAADVAEPVAVLVLLQLAHEFGAVGA